MPKREAYPPGFFTAAPVAGKARQHAAQKPLDVMEWVLAIVPPGSIVCDPFCGSGSTLVAAKRLGMRAIGIEFDPVNAAIAAERVAETKKI